MDMPRDAGRGADHGHTLAEDEIGAFQVPPSIQEYRDLARRIVREELMPLEREFLASDKHAYGLPPMINIRSVFDKKTADRLEGIAQDSGLFKLLVPEEFGGPGLSLLAQVVIEEEFNYCAVPFPFANVPNILYECRGDQVERFLQPVIDGVKTTAFAQTEPGAGSDPGGMMTTRATRADGGWVLNGTKMWISNAGDCDVLMVQAVTDPEKRQRGGITMFLLDRGNPGMRVEVPGIATWLGPRASQHIIHFDDCFVPDKDVLGEVGRGFSLGQRWLTIHDRLMRGPYALGKMQRALDMSIDWAKERKTFGKPIAERQAIQWKLVDMHVDITALRAMTYQMAARADTGEDVRAEAALVKMTSTDWGARCLDHAIQVHGAMGESLELPLTLFYRVLRHAQIGGGTSEIQRVLIARKLLA
ncbi:(R)-benzylsuccinyl-CoA dehydrogenase [Methylobacterium brachiatum]|uniref:acyl-CoA dehydrogenase family protein n=1 Tax=Methylobacterium sp. E-066 TaxID=2836584 RepID=UPI001380D742|nr:acyl-CoA dehydrogenase family protein [Methylobacterium sp. E-066]MCJ2144780.1 acyl-CoA/acyl-ACP dehydrogenase [Methylobacterium sp. E-066]CAA2158563.1 (R)-benzylsuccinyl-CoA dehydrogenase [Methylobacterium brachiatum]